ncbi:hypothetical protein EYF80_014880 [Liparis tanakae]|uniref:Uncharacterized protein n=1 Tax=Liparis tanakae TaxID=230148 RepID=A0A4Z2IC26_9TELE|nr:hypothetical protein EYF80_014880 [Liparis tanakae]
MKSQPQAQQGQDGAPETDVFWRDRNAIDHVAHIKPCVQPRIYTPPSPTPRGMKDGRAARWGEGCQRRRGGRGVFSFPPCSLSKNQDSDVSLGPISRPVNLTGAAIADVCKWGAEPLSLSICPADLSTAGRPTGRAVERRRGRLGDGNVSALGSESTS